MGNAITISVALDFENNGPSPAAGNETAFHAGQALTGTVVVKVTKRVKGEPIILVVQGKETVRFRQDTKTNVNERNLILANISLADKSGEMVKPGEYAYKFGIFLPAALPSSMSLMGHSSRGCRIDYKVAAIMGQVKTERYFRVAAAARQNITVPCFVEPKTEQIYSMNVLSVGSVTFGASVNNTHVSREQVIDVSIACINNSSVDIKSVDLKMVEMVFFSAPNNTMNEKISLMEMRNIALPGIVTTATSMMARTLQGTRDATRSQQIFQALQSGENVIQITIPTHARDSYKGAIITIQHYLKIKILTGPFASTLFLKIPINIGYRSPDGHSPEELNVPMPQAFSEASAALLESAPTAPQTTSAPTPSASQVAPAALSDQDIPLVAATLVPMSPPSDTTQARPSNLVTAHAVIINGGTPQQSTRNLQPDVAENDQDEMDDALDLSALTPLSAPPSSAPSLNRLLDDMTSSVDAYALISERVQKPEWRSVFESLQPTDFGNVMAHVSTEFDQPRAASMVASHVKQFTCAHAVEALRKTSDWNRTTVVTKLIPLCKDFKAKHGLIKTELTSWEQTVVTKDFEQALNGGKPVVTPAAAAGTATTSAAAAATTAKNDKIPKIVATIF